MHFIRPRMHWEILTNRTLSSSPSDTAGLHMNSWFFLLGVWICYNHHSAPGPRNTDWLNERIFTLSLAHCKSLIYDDVAATFLMKTSNANQRETEKEAQSMGASTAYNYIYLFFFLFKAMLMHWRGWTESTSQANVSCGSNYWRLLESRVWDPLLTE